MDTVLVTGGCGYIGSHTCISLIENNFNVLIIDSLINSYEETYIRLKKIIEENGFDSHNKISFIKGDLRNKAWLGDVFARCLKADTPIKSVIHFAGLKSIETSINYPLDYWNTNISITLSLLAVMKEYKCHTIIFSSSATVYKSKGNLLLNESDDLEPSNPYGKTKLTIENILEDLYQSENNKNWKIANLRYFNPVGAHYSGLIGENPKIKSSNLFPSILRSLNGLQEKLFIFGKDWPTKDGTCIRDFIHVMDLAEAHISTLNYLQKNNSQKLTLNIGTGKGISVLEVIKTFQTFKKVNLVYEFVQRRIGDQPTLVADNSLALELLDWMPKRSLYDMCKDYIKNKVFN